MTYGTWLRPLIAVAMAVVVLNAPSPAAASDYPSRPVRIMIGFPPGGATDIVGRLIASKLQERLEQPFVVENRAGAGGSLGAETVAKAPADGYTLGHLTGAQLTINPALFPNLPYAPLKDFAPVGFVASAPLVLAVNASVPAKTLPELISLLKAKPGTYAFGTPGNGTPQHLTLAMFMALTGTDVLHVPYKGAAPMVSDLVGGQVQLAFDNLAILPHLSSGKLRAIAVAQSTRSPILPDVPTMKESGLSGIDAFTWYGLVAPAGTPRPVIDQLNAEIRAILELPEIRKRLADLGADANPGSPDDMRAFVASELAKWTRVVKEYGVKVD